MNDRLQTVIEKIIKFRDDRDWAQYHDPKNLSQALGIEAAELQEILLWKTTEESRELSSDEIKNVKQELADVFIYLVYLCHEFQIDLLDAVTDKIEINGRKYPVEKSKGFSRKYDEL